MVAISTYFRLCEWDAEPLTGPEDEIIVVIGMYGEGVGFMLHAAPDEIELIVSEIKDALQHTEEERQQALDEDLAETCNPRPELVAAHVVVKLEQLVSLQVMYNAPDRNWLVVFEDEDTSQMLVVMTTIQLSSFSLEIEESSSDSA